MSRRTLPTLPPGSKVLMDYETLVDLAAEVRALRGEVADFRARIDKHGYTRAQIAQMTGRSLHTVGEWVREGKVVGGRRVYLNENALTGLTTVSDFNEFYNLFNNSSPESR